LRIMDGSASATTTNNYGIYIGDQSGTTATNNYQLYSNGAGVNPFVITSLGNVGIGTSTPNATLFVQGVDSAPTVNPFVVASSTGSQLLTVLPSGNVGVGATSPETNLHVVNTSAGLESMPLLLQNSSSNSGTAVKVRLAATTSQGANANGLIDFVGTRQSDGSMDLNFLLSPGGSGAPTSRVYIDGSTGALGIGIATLTGQAAQAGISYLIQFVAMISINLAVLNIMPFPALDGGRLALVVWERIRGRALAHRTEQLINAAGFAVLLLLMVAVTMRDVVQFF
jgi:membrane-associated protease RseP (regulator of RpoE activity)